MDSAASFGVKQGSKVTEADAPRLGLLLFSAKSDVSLQGAVEKHSKYIERHGPSRLQDMAYTLATRRQHHDYRTFAVADGVEPLITQSTAKAKNSAKSLVFVFTGQGAQWAQMGKDLIQDFPSVREDIQDMDSILSQCHTPPSWSILSKAVFLK